MTTPAQRNAHAALDAARSAVARLDSVRGPEDRAADLIDIWSAVESALRSLAGSTSLTGQALIREVRQRQLIDFDQANALADLQAVHDRLQSTTYHPSDSDVAAARAAFLKLDAALVDAPAPPSATGPRDPMMRDTTATTATAPPPAPTTVVLSTERRIPSWAILAASLVVVVGLGIGGYFLFGHRGSSDALEQGIDAYTKGQREVAANAFSRAERENPASPRPHIYLARMARDVGNYTLATQELKLAIEADPNNALALREMGANLLMQNNYELARTFYVRAVQLDPSDKTAMGYLGCSLMRLGRTTEAATFMNRAGPGPWNNCGPAAAKPAADPASAGLVKP